MKRDKIRQRAEKYARLGKTAKAIAEYQKLIKSDPTDLNALNTLGDLYSREAKIHEAIKHFKLTAERYVEEGFVLKAIAIYKKMFRLDPSLPEISLSLAELQAQQGLPREAEIHFLAASELYRQSGTLKKAIEILELVLDSNSDHLEARTKLAVLYSEDARMDEALKEYEAIGAALKQRERFEEAEIFLKKALEIDPTNSALQGELSNLNADRSEPTETLDELRTLQQDSPEDYDLLCRFAMALIEAEDTDEATGLLESIWAGEDIPAYLLSSEEFRLISSEYVATCRDGGQEEHAEEIAKTLIEACDDQDELHKLIPLLTDSEDDFAGGDVEEEEGDGQDEELQKALDEADVFIRYGLQSKAREWLERMAEQYPANISIWSKMKELYLEAENVEKAAAACRTLADLWRDRGDEEKAKAMHEEADNLAPASPSSEEQPQETTDEELATPLPEAAQDILPDDGDVLETGEIEVAIEEVGDVGEDLGNLDQEMPQETTNEESVEFSMDFRYEEEESSSEVEILSEADAEPEAESAELIEAETDELADEALPELIEEPVEAASGEQHDDLVESPVEAASGEQHEDLVESLVDSESSDEDYVDLASELAEDLLAGSDNHQKTQEGNLSAVLQGLKVGIGEEVEEGDFETHYQLGIAYKEMGLLDDAIGEFQKAAKYGEKRLECASMLGACFMDKGIPKLAARWFQKGLDVEGYEQDKYQGLQYDLATAYEAMEKYQEAFDLYSGIYGENALYRDVHEKIDALKEKLS